jgi:hypothetical protein
LHSDNLLQQLTKLGEILNYVFWVIMKTIMKDVGEDYYERYRRILNEEMVSRRCEDRRQSSFVL